MEINEKFIANPNYTTNEKCIYLSLLSKSNDFITYVSQPTISKELNLSRITIIRNIKALEEKQGIIKIKGVTETGGASTNTYILTKINENNYLISYEYKIIKNKLILVSISKNYNNIIDINEFNKYKNIIYKE